MSLNFPFWIPLTGTLEPPAKAPPSADPTNSIPSSLPRPVPCRSDHDAARATDNGDSATVAPIAERSRDPLVSL